MFDKAKLGQNDEELDDYRDFDDEHSERGSKLDDFGVDEDEEDGEEAPPAAPVPGTIEPPVPAVTAEPKPESAPPKPPAKKAAAKKVAAKAAAPAKKVVAKKAVAKKAVAKAPAKKA